MIINFHSHLFHLIFSIGSKLIWATLCNQKFQLSLKLRVDRLFIFLTLKIFNPEAYNICNAILKLFLEIKKNHLAQKSKA